MRRSIIGIVSIAPVTEVSGQGRALAQLFTWPEAGSGVVMSDQIDRGSMIEIVRSFALTKPRGRWAERIRRRGFQRAADLMLIYETIRRRSVEIKNIARAARCDALIGCSGSHYDLAATARASRQMDIPFLAYLFDDPIDQWQLSHHRLAARVAAWIWLPTAKAVFVPNEFLEKIWSARNTPTILVRNPAAYDEEASTPRDRVSQFPTLGGGNRSKISIVYTGSIYHAQADAFRNLLTAMDRLSGRFHLHIFTEQSAERIASFGVIGPYVTHHKAVPANEIPQLLASASILFLPLAFESGIAGAIRASSPGKLGDYLTSGRPILAHVPPDGFVADYCRRHDCAYLVDRPDPSELVRALEFLARGGPEVERFRTNAQACAAEFHGPRIREIFWSAIDDVLSAEPPSKRSENSRSRGSILRSVGEWTISTPAILGRTGIVGSAKIAMSAAFNPDYYRFENASVRAVRANPLVDFLARGAAEGREPNRLFDRDYYLRQAGEKARTNPLMHYLRTGWRRGFDPGPFFSVSDYLNAYSDVRDGKLEPLGHYLSCGFAEGRLPFARFRLPQPLDITNASANERSRRFSVIVPTFNHGHFLPHALDSLLAQNFKNWEAIVVDDGSTDNTPSILASYVKRDLRIIAVHKANGGIASALNEGLRQASADWIMWLSADDLFRPNRMSVTADWIRRYPHVGLFHSDYALLHDATGRISECAHDSPEWLPTAPLWQSLAMLHSNLVDGITATFHRRLADALGGFRENLRYAQDYDFWLRASRRVPMAFIPESLALSRSYGGQTTVVQQRHVEREALGVVRSFIASHPLFEAVGGLNPANTDRLFAATRWVLELAAYPGGMFVRNGEQQALLEWIAASIAPDHRRDYCHRLAADIEMRRNWRGSNVRLVQLESLLKIMSSG